MTRGLWLATLCVLALTDTAAAAPEVTVRAHTRLQIERVRRRSETVAVVQGRLLEVGSDEGLPGLTIVVEVDGETQLLTTDRVGRFQAAFGDIGEGEHTATARFLGDEASEYEPAEVLDYRFELGKETPQLSLALPDEIEAGTALDVGVAATVGGDPIAIAVTVSVGPVPRLRLNTDENGGAHATLAPADLGPAGEKRIRVSFAGNDSFNPASTETLVKVMSTTRIADFGAPRERVGYEGTIVLAGRLLDETGAGVERQTVSVSAGGERVGAAVTDASGGFVVRLKASRFAPGALTVAAEYQSTTPWRRGARSSPPLTLTIAEPKPVPLAYTLGAFGITFLGVVGFALARTRPWLPLLEKWKKRKRGGGESGPAQARAGGDPAARETGLKLGRPSLMSTLKRPADHGLSGTVRDVITGRPIAGARLSFRLSDLAPHEILCDGAGQFVVDGLATGQWQAIAGFSGYVSERFTATIPHRGELREVRVDLMPVRERVFQLYRRVAYAMLPRAELWGVWTPREILEHVRRKRPGGTLGELTEFVEEAYFSARVPEEEVLARALALCERARAELGAHGARAAAIDPAAPKP